MRNILGLAIAVFCANQAMGSELFCPVSAKVDTTRWGQDGYFIRYTEEQLRQLQFAVIVRDRGDDGTEVGRCSFISTEGRVTCDFYKIDFVSRDSATGHRKYYYLRGQFDVQVFGSGDFVENNGRGSIATGRCEERY
jgi:hypothetical protein